jgi:hypothetical protein
MTEVNSHTRIAELKERIAELQLKVREAQDKLTLIRGRSDPTETQAKFQYRIADAKKWLNEAVLNLQKAKADLIKLSGVTGGDPRWDLIRDAWRYLQKLEDRGIDLGQDGAQLLNDIEFHIPASKLLEVDQQKRNGGVVCDTAQGPCACGATH